MVIESRLLQVHENPQIFTANLQCYYPRYCDHMSLLSLLVGVYVLLLACCDLSSRDVSIS